MTRNPPRVTHGRSHAGPATPYPDTWEAPPGISAEHDYQELEAAQPLIPSMCSFAHCHCSLCKRLILTGETFFHAHRNHPTIGWVCYDCGTACRLEFPAHYMGERIAVQPYGGS